MADQILQRATRVVTLVSRGELRTSLMDQISTAVQAGDDSDRGDALVFILGAAPASSDSHLTALRDGAEWIASLLEDARMLIQRVIGSVDAPQKRQNFVFVLDGAAAYGDADRVVDSTSVAALVSFARALAIEVGRMGSNVSTVLASFASDAQEPHMDAVMANRVGELIDEGVYANGQEIGIGDSSLLGRLKL